MKGFRDIKVWQAVNRPGFGGGTGVYFGDIYTNLGNGTLDSMVLANLADGTTGATPDDISLGIAWEFVLAAGEQALVRFVLATTPPAAGLSLVHTDPDSAASIFFWSSLDIRQQPVPAPAPATLAVFAAGLAALAAARRRPPPTLRP